MGKKWIVLLVAFAVAVVGTPLFIVRQLESSDEARNPHSLELPAGASTLIAGGKAKLWYACGESGREFEVESREKRRYVRETEKQPIAEISGIRVELLALENQDGWAPTAKFRISWRD